MNPISRSVAWLRKAISTAPMPFNRAFQYAWWNTKYHLAGEYNAQNAKTSAIVGACTSWLWRALSAAPLRVYMGEREIEPGAEYERILGPILNPNMRHTYSNFLWMTIRDLIQVGEVINHTLDRESVQVIPWEAVIQQLPNTGGDRVKYRTLTLSGQQIQVEADIVKTIWHPHPDNAFLGVSPLTAVNAELLLDKYAREATAGRLQSPVVGLLFQPKEVDGAILPESDRKDLEAELTKLKGTGVGDTFLGEARYDIKELQGVAHRFDYSLIYGLCEARICAQLGIPPAVAQMGVGLAQTRVGATMKEEVRLAYENGAIPVAAIIAESWSKMLLPAMGRTGYRIEFDFDSLAHLTEAEKTLIASRLMQMLAMDGLADAQRAAIMERLEKLERLA